MIYLDNMGHLFSDNSLEELFDFAVNELNLNPEWNHYSKNFPHFDLTTPNKKVIAKFKGAKLLEVRSAEWKEVTERVKNVFKDELPSFKSKGLQGQPITRVDYIKLGLKK